MAHDKQAKDSTAEGCMVKGFDCPKKGDAYWNRNTHRVDIAVKDMDEKFLIVEVER